MRTSQKFATFVLLITGTPLFAAAPASQPAIPAGPQAAALEFMTAMLSGDEPGAFAAIYLANDATKKDADAMIGQSAGEIELDQAIAKIPGAKPATDDNGPMLESIRQSIAKAKVTITGETAKVECSPGPTLFIVRDGGRWKLDFAQTQKANDSDDRQEVARATADAAVYRSMLTDVKAGKFKTEAEARTELAKRKAAAPAANDDAAKNPKPPN